MNEDNSLFSYVSRLNNIRAEESVLAYGKCTIQALAEGLLVIKRAEENAEITAIINFSKKEYILEADDWKKADETLIETEKRAVVIEDGRLVVKAEGSGVFRYLG